MISLLKTILQKKNGFNSLLQITNKKEKRMTITLLDTSVQKKYI
jgi:hypothetical protein